MYIDKHMHMLMHNFWESCITREHYQQFALPVAPLHTSPGHGAADAA